MVGTNGLEPSTSRLSGVRSNHLSYAPVFGGDEENRTPDPLLAKQVLSQLSYTPAVPYGTLKTEQYFSLLPLADCFKELRFSCISP